jgi:hypothetical protein
MSTIHNPVNFDPSAYRIVGYADNQPPKFTWFSPFASFEEGEAARREFMRRREEWLNEMLAMFPERNWHKCQHCGQGNVRYVCAAEHKETKERVCFGDICCDKLHIEGRDAFKAKRIRDAAAARARRENDAAKLAQTIENDLELKTILEHVGDAVHAKNWFVRDIICKLMQYGSISDKQKSAVTASMKRDVEYAANRPAEVVPTVEVKSGAYPIEGKVVAVKEYDNEFGVSWKMMVVNDLGQKFWCSVPSGISHLLDSEDGPLKGRRVKLTATWTVSDNDKFFAFGKRPRGATIVAK